MWDYTIPHVWYVIMTIHTEHWLMYMRVTCPHVWYHKLVVNLQSYRIVLVLWEIKQKAEQIFSCPPVVVFFFVSFLKKEKSPSCMKKEIREYRSTIVASKYVLHYLLSTTWPLFIFYMLNEIKVVFFWFHGF